MSCEQPPSFLPSLPQTIDWLLCPNQWLIPVLLSWDNNHLASLPDSWLWYSNIRSNLGLLRVCTRLFWSSTISSIANHHSLTKLDLPPNIILTCQHPGILRSNPRSSEVPTVLTSFTKTRFQTLSSPPCNWQMGNRHTTKQNQSGCTHTRTVNGRTRTPGLLLEKTNRVQTLSPHNGHIENRCTKENQSQQTTPRTTNCRNRIPHYPYRES